MDSNHTQISILTSGLRRILFGAFFFACALAAAQIVAVTKLQDEIGHWAWTSEINANREQLITNVYRLLGGQDDVDLPDVMSSFDGLRRSITRMQDNAPHQEIHDEFRSLEAQARELFLSAEDARGALGSPQQAIRQDVNNLQQLSGEWARQLRAEEQSILRMSELLDARKRRVEGLKALLTSVLLRAQALQQQVIAAQRLSETSSPEILRSSILALDSTGLPTVCAPNTEESGTRLCSPSVARVLSALETLQASETSDIPRNVNSALLGLQGYIRAGQVRLDTLTEESSEALAQMREVRQQLTDLRNLGASLSRINRVLLDMEFVVERQATGLAGLDTADREMRSYISQIRARMNGLLTISARLDGDPKLIAATAMRMANDWEALRETISERIETLDRFDETMEALSSRIASHASRVRNETTLWVSLYASSFLVLAGALVACVVGLFFLARRRFVRPLLHVTGTIIDLARGNLDQPIDLQERAFGFDMLGQALERLRMEMIERRKLAERNAEQQKTIESNLATLKSTSEEMKWMALHDPLTGIGNRRQADLDLEDLTRTAQASGCDFCVMHIDIDRFKAINDSLGHPAGDHVLKSVSHILMDTAGPEAKCYRVGGDEFLAVFYREVTNAQAAEIAGRIIRLIETPIEFNGHRCHVGASIGIAFGRDTGCDAMLCVARADLALYQMKKSNRGSFEFFTEELEQLSRRRRDISDRLLAAIEQKAFLPYYQPQFEAQTRELRGVEVLCRWNDDELGWVSPGEFLCVAGDLNALGAIDEILFEKVALDLQELLENGLSLPKVSFNITADRLLKSNLAKELTDRIGDRTKIALELLESMSLDNPTASIAWALDDLREHGIEIEIDDFGSDRASLAGLMAIGPQAMKIDRSIVIPIVESSRHREIVKKIIDIGAALNVEVVAEGVETEEHAAQLIALGCDVLQGFGLARPMPFSDLAAFCEARTKDQGDAPSAVA